MSKSEEQRRQAIEAIDRWQGRPRGDLNVNFAEFEALAMSKGEQDALLHGFDTLDWGPVGDLVEQGGGSRSFLHAVRKVLATKAFCTTTASYSAKSRELARIFRAYRAVVDILRASDLGWTDVMCQEQAAKVLPQFLQIEVPQGYAGNADNLRHSMIVEAKKRMNDSRRFGPLHLRLWIEDVPVLDN